jgi:hypothetical protein
MVDLSRASLGRLLVRSTLTLRVVDTEDPIPPHTTLPFGMDAGSLIMQPVFATPVSRPSPGSHA